MYPYLKWTYCVFSKKTQSKISKSWNGEENLDSEGQEECTPIWSKHTVFSKRKPKENPKEKKSPKDGRGRKKREREREGARGGEGEREGGGYKEKEYDEKLEEKTVYMIDGFLFFSDILSSENVILFEKF